MDSVILEIPVYCSHLVNSIEKMTNWHIPALKFFLTKEKTLPYPLIKKKVPSLLAENQAKTVAQY
jgi:hypothetical protein